jgi:hypothetical protein
MLNIFNRNTNPPHLAPPPALSYTELRSLRAQAEKTKHALRDVQVMLHNSRVYPTSIAPHDGDWVQIVFLPSNPQLNAAGEALLGLQESGYIALRNVEELTRLGGWAAQVKVTYDG